METVTPTKHADWAAITKSCKELEGDHAKVQKDLKPGRSVLLNNVLINKKQCRFQIVMDPVVKAEETNE